jgi:beta-galactosidase
VPTADSLVRFVVEGGSLVALDNANMHDHTSYQSDSKRAFNGKALAIVRASRAGIVRVSASADGLRSATVEITVRRGAVLPMVPAVQEN